MPRHYRNLIYSSEDWNLMQWALRIAAEKLHRDRDHEDTDRLARRVMTLFDRGLRDANIIASAAAYQETLAARIATRSGKNDG
jgi:hypothetical protein